MELKAFVLLLPPARSSALTELLRMKSALIVAILLGASPVAAFCVAGRPLMRASTRAPAPQLVLGRVRKFVSNRLPNRFRNDNDAEEDAFTGEARTTRPGFDPSSEAGIDQKRLSAADSVLVKFGLKTEDEYVTCYPILGQRPTQTARRLCIYYIYTRCVLPEEGEDLMEQIKCAGRAGIISYILWVWQLAREVPPRACLEIGRAHV